eukprot:CAMPEP_0201546324 /NCGR_PEP_ID=MMETSP0173_2-20130828/2634_1 /ASSEMBLY_ACC=CAM_ASM_000268 /TAXON_ID=218659 /ORGANISM="Vexillifera sp., Strain DIVA3 564/2" /LENGTH=954 /DNA_ID=CAMNT_0047954953 /DNA_START=468 /DNA_END=3329 /DNA_ORIENTATION=-
MTSQRGEKRKADESASTSTSPSKRHKTIHLSESPLRRLTGSFVEQAFGTSLEHCLNAQRSKTKLAFEARKVPNTGQDTNDTTTLLAATDPNTNVLLCYLPKETGKHLRRLIDSGRYTIDGVVENVQVPESNWIVCSLRIDLFYFNSPSPLPNRRHTTPKQIESWDFISTQKLGRGVHTQQVTLHQHSSGNYTCKEIRSDTRNKKKNNVSLNFEVTLPSSSSSDTDFDTRYPLSSIPPSDSQENLAVEIHAQLESFLDSIDATGTALQETEPNMVKLSINLRAYQKQALSWLIQRELPEQEQRKLHETHLQESAIPIDRIPVVRGGILADEMGMGKTIEMLALIATNLPPVCRRSTKTPVRNLAPFATLVVCPLSVLDQWRAEIERHTHQNALSVYLYHGSSRRKDPRFLSTHHIVLTTFSTLAIECPQKKGGKQQAQKKITARPLLEVNWFRVILDEGHTIKDRNTRTARAAFMLRAERRWCVSGTPIQNKLDDLFSLLHFLRVEHYGKYSYWSTVILKPIKNGDNSGYQRLRAILSTLLLRRTKEQRSQFSADQSIVPLPPRIVRVRFVDLSPPEREFYDALQQVSNHKFEHYASTNTVSQNYARILELVLRLRQACDHPYLVAQKALCDAYTQTAQQQSSNTTTTTSSSPSQPLLNEDDFECVLCMENLDVQHYVVTPCEHHFCYQCICDHLKQKTNGDGTCRCPNCRLLLKNGFNDFSEVRLKPQSKPTSSSSTSSLALPTYVNIASAAKRSNQKKSSVSSDGRVLWGGVPFKTSTKVSLLIQELSELRKKDASVKSIVFSQWTNMLDVVEAALLLNNLGYERLDGSMTPLARTKAIRRFQQVGNSRIFLISMKAGSQGLNLIRASRVFLLDPWWNPATEQQAIDRVHRLGQTRPVIVTRFVIRNSIEQKILKLQQAKLQSANQALRKHTSNKMDAVQLSAFFETTQVNIS